MKPLVNGERPSKVAAEGIKRKEKFKYASDL